MLALRFLDGRYFGMESEAWISRWFLLIFLGEELDVPWKRSSEADNYRAMWLDGDGILVKNSIRFSQGYSGLCVGGNRGGKE
jgi:hypothetical protein